MSRAVDSLPTRFWFEMNWIFLRQPRFPSVAAQHRVATIIARKTSFSGILKIPSEMGGIAIDLTPLACAS